MNTEMFLKIWNKRLFTKGTILKIIGTTEDYNFKAMEYVVVDVEDFNLTVQLKDAKHPMPYEISVNNARYLAIDVLDQVPYEVAF
jgi:hypothetical protein